MDIVTVQVFSLQLCDWYSADWYCTLRDRISISKSTADMVER
jgi:hypothetical protein